MQCYNVKSYKDTTRINRKIIMYFTTSTDNVHKIQFNKNIVRRNSISRLLNGEKHAEYLLTHMELP